MPTLDQLITEQNTIHSELERLAADPDTTEEADGNLRDTLIARWKDLDGERAKIMERMNELQLIRQASQTRDGTEAGDEGAGPGGGAGSPGRWGPRSPQFMARRDPFADMDAIRGNRVLGADLVARAHTAIELHDKRGLLFDGRGEEATRKAAGSPAVARHMLLTGHDDYLEAFRTYLNDPMGEGQVARTSLLTSTSTAGFLLPYVLDTQIILTNSGSTNPYRRVARVVTTNSNAWQGVNSAGVGVAWIAEGAQATDTGSAVGQIQVIPQKAAAWVTGSFEVMSDTDYASQLPGMLADAKDIAEEAAFALGTGGTSGPLAGMPLGILMGLTASQRVAPALPGTAGGAFGTPGGQADVYNLNAALGPRFRLSPNVAWLANITTINKVRALDQYGGGSFWVNLGGDTPDRLLGKPIYESPSMIAAGTGGGTAIGSAAAVFGDFSKFIIVDRIGSTMLFDPMLKSVGTPNIPTGTQGWFYYWRVGSGVAAANAFRWISNT